MFNRDHSSILILVSVLVNFLNHAGKMLDENEETKFRSVLRVYGDLPSRKEEFSVADGDGSVAQTGNVGLAPGVGGSPLIIIIPTLLVFALL